MKVGTEVTVCVDGRKLKGTIVELIERDWASKYRVRVQGKGTAFVFFEWELQA